MLPKYDFLDELKNVCIKISLLQAIKEILILAKKIKELSIKNQDEKQKKFSILKNIFYHFTFQISNNRKTEYSTEPCL